MSEWDAVAWAQWAEHTLQQIDEMWAERERSLAWIARMESRREVHEGDKLLKEAMDDR